MNPIETERLTRRFLRNEAVVDLDLRVPAGSVSVLLGSNGAGKTTTLKLLLNLITPTRGKARILGVDSRDLGPSELSRIGYVSENQRLPDHLGVGEFLGRWRPLYPTWDRDFENRLLQMFDLQPSQRLRHLSRGMRMKAALAAVLSYRPNVLILDEPFSGLDLLVRDQLVQALLDLVSGEGCTVLLSSHEITEVETLTDRLYWLDHGRLKLDESADSLRARFRRIEIQQPAMATAPAVPEHAWQVERAGSGARYIDPHFDPRAVPAAAMVTPMTLREIFVALLRQRGEVTTTPAVAA